MRSLRAPLVLLLLATVTFALAQARDAFDLHAADFRLLTMDSVKKELKITQDQRARMNKHADAHAATLTRLDKQQSAAKDKRAMAEKLMPQVMSANDKLADSVLKELSAVQLKRLREISLQRLGPSALGDTKTGKKVGMTDAQIARLRKVYETAAAQADKLQEDAFKRVTAGMPKERPKDEKKAKELYEEGMRRSKREAERIRPQIEALGKRTDASALAILTPQQRQAWTNLQGKPFKP